MGLKVGSGGKEGGVHVPPTTGFHGLPSESGSLVGANTPDPSNLKSVLQQTAGACEPNQFFFILHQNRRGNRKLKRAVSG